MKYTKEEILQILRNINDQKNQLDMEVCPSEYMTYEMKVKNWISYFGMAKWHEVAEFYEGVFGLNFNKKEWQNVFFPIKEKTLGDLCEFISKHAGKPEIKPLKLFGKYCEDASIFRHLIKRIKKNHPDIGLIKPSSVIEKYMDKIYKLLIIETNLIASGILPPVKYKSGGLDNQGGRLFGAGILVLFIAAVFDNWFIGGIGLGLFISGIWTINKSIGFPSGQFEFEGIATFRDLVFKIKKYRNAAQRYV